MTDRKAQYQRWCENLDEESLVSLRHRQWRIKALLEGFLGARSKEELEVLRLLRERGPLSRRDLCCLRKVAYHAKGDAQLRLLRNLLARGLVRKVGGLTNGCRWGLA